MSLHTIHQSETDHPFKKKTILEHQPSVHNINQRCLLGSNTWMTEDFYCFVFLQLFYKSSRKSSHLVFIDLNSISATISQAQKKPDNISISVEGCLPLLFLEEMNVTQRIAIMLFQCLVQCMNYQQPKRILYIK